MDEFTALVNLLGGGLPAVVIAGLSIALVFVVRLVIAQINGRMDDKDKHAAELKECTVMLYETTKRLEAAMNAVGRA